MSKAGLEACGEWFRAREGSVLGRRFCRSTGIAWGAVVALGVLVVVTASQPVAKGALAESGSPPPMPAPPAFFTEFVSRIQKVEGAAFDVCVGGLEVIRVRLRDAECEGLDEKTREKAQWLTSELLGTEPVWIFPAGRPKDEPDGLLRVRVWTRKGWLSEVLINAHLAKRRTGGGASLVARPEEPLIEAEKAGPPPPPAFRATVEDVSDDGTLTVASEGGSRNVRFSDVTCEAGERLKTTIEQTLGTEPVWVFPSSRRRTPPDAPLPARIWTSEGNWLSDTLLDVGLATYRAEPDEQPEETSEPAKVERSPPKQQEPKKQIVWRKVPVTVTRMSRTTSRVETFTIKSSVWRVSWRLEPAMLGQSFLMVWRKIQVEPMNAVPVRGGTLSGYAGTKYFRINPGTFGISLVNVKEPSVQIEVHEKVSD
ncbi:MAG: hypothetical protein WBC59_03635 [Phycisphaerae bacterium]